MSLDVRDLSNEELITIINKLTKWYYPDDGEYPTKPNLCIRYIDISGDEFIGYTEWYYPSEDEVGYGSCVIDVICNGVSVDPNDIKMWCELPYPPKEEENEQN